MYFYSIILQLEFQELSTFLSACICKHFELINRNKNIVNLSDLKVAINSCIEQSLLTNVCF